MSQKFFEILTQTTIIQIHSQLHSVSSDKSFNIASNFCFVCHCAITRFHNPFAVAYVVILKEKKNHLLNVFEIFHLLQNVSKTGTTFFRFYLKKLLKLLLWFFYNLFHLNLSFIYLHIIIFHVLFNFVFYLFKLIFISSFF